MFIFDTLSTEWNELTGLVGGVAPLGRRFPGFAATNKSLFIFGGYNINLGIYNFMCNYHSYFQLRGSVNDCLAVTLHTGTFGDLLSVYFPNSIPWPVSAAYFLDIYDWDTILLHGTASISIGIDLCSGIFPCALNVRGLGPASTLSIVGGSVSCLVTNGCSTVRLGSLSITCSSAVAAESVFRMQGSSLVIQNSTVSGCSSVADGGFAFAYGMASVQISSCIFEDMHTTASGGVVKAAGSLVMIQESNFINCSAVGGGGVLWAAAYICTGSSDALQTEVHIDRSNFIFCSSSDSGGSILITSEASISNDVVLHLQSTTFQHCSAALYGGAIHCTGPLSKINLFAPEFLGCYAMSGGAVSIQDVSQAAILLSIFKGNSAGGMGGGAIYARDSDTVFVGLSCADNSAPAGGGGVILWDSAEPPLLAEWCLEGSYSSQNSNDQEPSCTTCAEGTYQSGQGLVGDESCVPCPAGYYSAIVGTSQCSTCQAGKYWTGTGAKDSGLCRQCEIGTFSLSSATSCASCMPGSYTKISGASACLLCSLDSSKNSSLCNRSLILRSFDTKCEPPDAECQNSRISEQISDPNGHLKETAWQTKGSGTTIPSRLHCSSFKSRTKKQINAQKNRYIEFRGQSHFAPTVDLEANIRSRRSINFDNDPRQIIEISSRAIAQKQSETFDESQSVPSSRLESNGWCGAGNQAAYGDCIASSYKRLKVTASDSQDPQVYPGLSFPLLVQKLDAYNQTVLTDSTSVLQVYTPFSGHLAILGQVIVRMQGGRAAFDVALKPAFIRVDGGLHIADLAQTPVLYFEGTDTFNSDSDNTMKSDNIVIRVPSGDKVCPVGYILKLDSPVGSTRSGTCAFCSEGTYSIFPLLGGSNSTNPACAPCPLQALQNGDCARGGSIVHFTLGRWEISSGMYRLVGCPAGYRMVNSVDGVFSYQIQQCLRCGLNEYVLNSSNPTYDCQTCPQFLICDGANVSSRYPAAQVSIDFDAGLYLLTGCPSGSEISPDRLDCTVCAPLYFCTGGSTGKLQCPANTFSTAGANSSSSCLDSVFVNIVVLMPVSVGDFGADSRAKFASAVASASKLPADRVVVVSVTPSTAARRSTGVDVQAKLAAQDSAKASKVVSELNQAALNDALAATGLPAGLIQRISVGDGTTVVVSGLGEAGVAGVASGVLIFFLALACGGLAAWARYRKNESNGERILRLEIAALRRRLGLCKRDGFYLSYEAGPLWRRRDRTVFILRNEMEAAARLSLLQEFDTKSFDAFCHCLEYSGFVLHRGEGEQEGSSPPQYQALCDWLLEICRTLIEPAILKRRRGCQGPAAGDDDLEAGPEEEDEQGAARRRFAFFKRRVALARVWVDRNKQLWRRLKRVAMDYMDEIAPICDARRDSPRRRVAPRWPQSGGPTGGLPRHEGSGC